MTSFEIRKLFLDFFKRRGHKHLPGSSLIPQEDPSLLFVNAGMNQFKSVFLGLAKPPAQNAVTIQKCLRAGGKHNDLENVGRTPRHHTFFEMMGNFSFGGYFKKKALQLAWEFLTEVLRLPAESLWVTVFEEDGETETLWREEINIPPHKILKCGEKDNFWRMAATGPCGPCSEIHYYSGLKKRPAPEDLTEIWNLVFMEFNEDEKGNRTPLPVKCVDTGAGLERLSALMQNKQSNYHTDLFRGIIQTLEKESGVRYDWTEKSQNETQTAFRVLADHGRAVTFLINDGVCPGNEGRSYILRRILRRAFFYGNKLNPNKNFLKSSALKVTAFMGEAYPELSESLEKALSVIDGESAAFNQNLKEGKKRLFQEMDFLSSEKKFIDARTVWRLYDTYGFPADLTRLIAKEKGWEAASDEEVELYKQKEQKRLQTAALPEAHKDLLKGLAPETLRSLTGGKTILTCYEKEEEEGRILYTLSPRQMDGFSSSGSGFQEGTAPSWDPLKKGQRGLVILDKTCFYPEGGGPVGDRGELKTKTGKAEALDCQKIGDFIFHEVAVTEGEIKGENPRDPQNPADPDETKCKIKVDPNHRRAIKAGHSATHLLHKALRGVLGADVRQAGSLIDAEKLRFDFTYGKPLTERQQEEIENQVNADIQAQNPVSASLKSFDEAKKTGALFLAGENYSDQVRVITMGASRELCGGIHVKNTSEIGPFKIISETGVKSGVRRITAYTSEKAERQLNFLADQNRQIRAWLSSRRCEFSGPRAETDLEETNKAPILSELSDVKQSLSERSEKKSEGDNPFILWFQDREREIKQLKNQLKNLIPPKGASSIESGKSDKTEKTGGDDKAVTSEDDKSPSVDFSFAGGGFLKLKHQIGEGIKKAFRASNKQEDLSQGIQKTETLSDEKIKHGNTGKKTELKREKAVREILELQKRLKLPAVLCSEKKSPFIPLMERKARELKSLKRQVTDFPWESVTGEKLKEPSGTFHLGGVKGQLVIRDLPVTDTKILPDMADQLKMKISSGVVVVFGDGEAAWPVVVTVTRNLQKHVSAGDLLKNTVSPLLGGKGGGPPRLARGVITDKTRFSDLKQTLLSALKKKPDGI